MPSGDLVFFFRDGSSGRGNLVINSYDLTTRKWQRLHNILIDGEDERNAYWQACTDSQGTIHLSWVWRETWDVETNHDLCYAQSKDGGKTWLRSDGTAYQLPINASTAEYALRIPQKSELINQTSMSADETGNPFIATYFRIDSLSFPQYQLIYRENAQWHTVQVSDRKTGFSLSGGGTKRIPISRPKVLVDNQTVVVLFRDEERGEKASAYHANRSDLTQWQVHDITSDGLGAWEPTYDTEYWKREGVVHLFTQEVGQGDGEQLEAKPATPARVVQWQPR
jgi:hypothetical protein